MSEFEQYLAEQLRLANREIRRLREEFVAIAHVCASQPHAAAVIVLSQVEQMLISSERRYPIPEDQ